MVTLQHYISGITSRHNIGCCTASATLIAVEILLGLHGIRKKFSCLYLYYMTRAYYGRRGQRGAHLKDTLLALSAHGVPSEHIWPFLQDNVDVEPPASVVEQAQCNRLHEYEELYTTEFKSYIDNNIPVIIGINTGRLYWTPPVGNNSYYKPINISNNRFISGHAITVIGYDNTLAGGAWVIADMCNSHLMQGGIGIIPYDCDVDICEAYIIKSFAGISSGKKI